MFPVGSLCGTRYVRRVGSPRRRDGRSARCAASCRAGGPARFPFGARRAGLRAGPVPAPTIPVHGDRAARPDAAGRDARGRSGPARTRPGEDPSTMTDRLRAPGPDPFLPASGAGRGSPGPKGPVRRDRPRHLGGRRRRAGSRRRVVPALDELEDRHAGLRLGAGLAPVEQLAFERGVGKRVNATGPREPASSHIRCPAGDLARPDLPGGRCRRHRRPIPSRA